MTGDRRGSEPGRRGVDRLVPVLVGMLLVFMVCSAVATTVALLNRADISAIEQAAKDSAETRTFSRAVFCAVEKGVIVAGEKTITGELIGLPPEKRRTEAAALYRAEVVRVAESEARRLGIDGFPGLTSDGKLDCVAFVRGTEQPKP